jgi:uncharacterized protein
MFQRIAPELERCLMQTTVETPALFTTQEIRRETVWVSMRDGVRLATDLYWPPRRPAPTLAMRSPYGRAHPRMLDVFIAFAQRGYIVAAQDCRGTGDSEPDSWDYYMYEPQDGFDFVEWISRQEWFDGFLGAFGSSYVAQTQWCMALHPLMSTIVPEVSGLGIAISTARYYMFLNAYSRSVGKGADKVAVAYDELERRMLGETLAGGYFNEPLHQPFSEALLSRYHELRVLPHSRGQRWLWEHYCALSCAERAELIKQALGVSTITTNDIESLTPILGHAISHDAHTLPHAEPASLCRTFHAPALMITGWYDWWLHDALATWELLMRSARGPVRTRSRLIITPSAHNTPGYHEGSADHPELRHHHRVQNHVDLLLRWYATVQEGKFDSWPTVIYYLMGANTWCAASAWPPPEAQPLALYLGAHGALSTQPPQRESDPDRYAYDPTEPTPTVGGSIVSYVYKPGSVDVSAVQERPDVLVYTTAPLECDLDVVGPVRLILYASSSAVDTDFSARLSDVFPDGRAIHLQSGTLRARYRHLHGEPELLEPNQVYRFEIDMWATANRFRAGHRLRLDIASADFPRFDRNANRGGEPGDPVAALQTIYHDPERPSHLVVAVLFTAPRAIPG